MPGHPMFRGTYLVFNFVTGIKKILRLFYFKADYRSRLRLWIMDPIFRLCNPNMDFLKVAIAGELVIAACN